MRLNDDTSKSAIVHSARLEWVPSPSAGVERRMLYREGDEVARATTVVRYLPGTFFPSHTHTGGEAYFVLDGVFQDEAGDHGPGRYVRNPPGSKHAPGSKDGCTILVWLFQFDERDDVAVDVEVESVMPEVLPSGAQRRVLHEGHDRVFVEELPGGASLEVDLPNGGELFVLEGALLHGEVQLERHTWVRNVAGSSVRATAQGSARVLVVERGAKTRLLALP